jgi:indole-3-glycerol phosphate synthase
VATGFLAEMARASTVRARALAEVVGRRTLELRAAAAPPPVQPVLSAAEFDLVAELKLASPADGRLARANDPDAIVARSRDYEAGGACALSVLTEPTRFEGELAHLAAAAGAVAAPVMRKDFLVDPLQVLEARAAGASGVLLVLRLLDDHQLEGMLAAAREHGLFVLLEAFDAADLSRAARVLERARRPALWIGVNARDLVTLAVDRDRHRVLASRLPSGVPCVAESGLERADDVRAARAAGYRLALVGSALMRAADPRSCARSLLAAGRRRGGFP